MTTAWYGKSAAKQLQQLLQTKPQLLQLLNAADFIQQLKSYNSKLLDYFTNNPYLIGEAIELMIVPPSHNDSHDRKFKYPLQVIEMIQTQTTCVYNSFFKDINSSFKDKHYSQNTNNASQNGTQYFDLLFNILQQEEILPILAGYFFRTNISLLNNRYKETLDRIYLKPHVLSQLLNHSSLMPIVNIIQLYLNLDINKSSQSDNARLQVKKDLVKKIIGKIDTQRKLKRPQSGLIIENLMTVLIQTIEKYYLILDGKVLVQILTSQQCIETMLSLIKQNWQGAYPAFNFFISLINYYSFSSFNSDETDPDKKAKNLQRLQAQPMVIGLRIFFPNALDKIVKTNLVTLYEYKLLEILCHCISISSEQLLKTIKDTKFFTHLINLMFKHEQNNILHMLIQKSFLHVFISERKIYDQYKKHLFCELDIIQITAGRVLSTFSQQKIFDQFKTKVYFGHFMRILKIYSGIQTTEQVIINCIKSKTQVWNKISTFLIKPYQTICFKELGTYDNIPEGNIQQFEVTRSKLQANLPNTGPRPLTTSMIEEIRKEDQALLLKKQDQLSNILPGPIKEEIIHEKQKQEELLKSPTHNLAIQFRGQSRQIKKVESFKQFMTKKKVEAEKQIKLKRSLSHQKRLSGSKGKITGASPKKNSWTDKGQQATQGNDSQSLANSGKISGSTLVNNNKNSQIPRIPYYSHKNVSLTSSSQQSSSAYNSQGNSVSSTIQSNGNPQYRSYYGSLIQNKGGQSSNSLQAKLQQESSRTSVQTKSEKNMEILRKIKVIRIDAPKQKKYRRLQEKDKILLDFLGITSGVK